MAGLKSTNTTQYKAKQSVSTTCIIQDIYTQYEGLLYTCTCIQYLHVSGKLPSLCERKCYDMPYSWKQLVGFLITANVALLSSNKSAKPLSN